jgi:hypothetical protein
MLMLGLLLFGVPERDHGKRDSDLFVFFLLLVPGAVLTVAGGCMGCAAPKGIGLRERAYTFVGGVAVLAALGAGLTSGLIESARLRLAAPARDTEGPPRPDRPAPLSRGLTFLRHALLVALFVTELTFVLFTRGVLAALRGRRPWRLGFRCLVLVFVLVGVVLAVAWREEWPGLVEPDGWAAEHVWWAVGACGLAALCLLVLAGRAHQTITAVLLRPGAIR